MSTTLRTGVLVVSLLGCAQALFLATALVFRPVNRRASRILALMLVAMAIYLANGAYLAADLVARWPMFFAWSQPTPLLFGPLLYLYAVHATDADRPWQWYDALHVVPAVLAVIVLAPVFAMSASEKLALVGVMRAGEVPSAIAGRLQITYWLRMLSGVAYTACTVLVVRAHRRHIRQQFSTLDRITLDWLVLLAGASVIAWVLAGLARWVEPAGLVPIGTGDSLISVVLTGLTYLVGYRGLQQPELHREMSAVPALAVPPQAVPTQEAPSREAHTESTTIVPAAARPDRALLTPGMAQAIATRLHQAMEQEQLWRDADLTLGRLADHLQTSTHKLSEVLNGRVEQTFHDYVNAFRVREVQHQLTQPEAQHRTLLAMALDAGFASKSTFNAVFRKHTGMTPSGWRDMHSSGAPGRDTAVARPNGSFGTSPPIEMDDTVA